MKLSLTHTMIVAALAMFFLIALSPFVRERPRSLSDASPRQRSIARSGLPLRADLFFRGFSLIAITCVGAVFFWSNKLDQSLGTQDDVIRLRRHWKIYNFLLLIAVILAVIQIFFAILGLLTIEYLGLADILHSRILDGLMALFIYISFFAATRKHTKAIQRLSASDILAFKHKDSRS
jgi:hypothetical protein